MAKPSFQKIKRSRAFFLFALSSLTLLGLIGRLFALQVVQGGQFAKMAVAERQHLITLPPSRGKIINAEGQTMAISVPSATIIADPKLVKHPHAEARLLSSTLHVPHHWVLGILQQKNQFAYIKRQITISEDKAISALFKKHKLPGISYQPTMRRYYPQGEMAAHVLGFVGVNGKGLAGVEQSYNTTLTGTPGQELQTVDAWGQPLPQASHILKKPVSGKTLQLTINGTLQTYVDKALVQAIKKTHATEARIIIENPNTGSIWAMANYPRFNPNHYGKYSPKDWSNTNVQAAYPPGSTFKIITGSAALATGVATPQSHYYDPGYKIVTGIRINNWYAPGFGLISFDKAVAESDDVAFMDIGLKLGVKRLYQYIHKFHLDRPMGIDLPGETPGVILPPNNVRPIDLADMAFGQSLETSPIGMINAISAVANGGKLMWPHVGKAIYSSSGHLLKTIQPRVISRVISPTVSKEMIHAMQAVVDYGTGAVAQLPGYVLAGKTGTSNLYANGKIIHHVYMGSFVEYGPIPNPKVIIYVQIYKPKGAFYGDLVAAPIVKKLMSETFRYLGIQPQGAVHNKIPNQTVKPTPITLSNHTVPNLVNRTIATGLSLLKQAQLKPLILGNGTTILRQFPSSGSQLPSSGLVTLITNAKGPLRKSVVKAPNLQGLSMRAAAQLLSAEGLHLQIQGSGIVTKQSPVAGTQLQPGATIKATFGP